MKKKAVLLVSSRREVRESWRHTLRNWRYYYDVSSDGTASFIVTWHPLGETGTPQVGSDTPGATTISGGINRATQNTLSITGLGSSYTYGDSAFKLATQGGSGSGAVTFTSSDRDVASVSGNTVTILKAGIFTITAVKAADAVYNTASVTSGTVTVSEAIPTVALTGENVDHGQNVTLTATVSGACAVPAGTVTFKEGNVELGTVTLDANGVASCTVMFPATGNHNYTAEYSGQAGYYIAATGTKSIGVGLVDQAALSLTGIVSLHWEPAAVPVMVLSRFPSRMTM